MKKTGLLLLCMLWAWCIQAADITIVSSAFKEGNAASLSGSMDTEVDIAVPGTSKKGRGADAVAVLTQFFQSNKPTAFSVAHQADKDDSGFVVGKLVTGKGDFRVNITYLIKNNKLYIQSIRIE